jgi:hypothetical protein
MKFDVERPSPTHGGAGGLGPLVSNHSFMRRFLVIALAAFLAVGLLPSPSGAAGGSKSLGRDASGDAPPALDVTSLSVGANSGTLEIQIGIEGMLPGTGGYPELPGIEWIFDLGGRTFLAEAVATDQEPAFYLFELKGGAYTQLDNPTGTYDHANGYASILIPFEDIGAHSGSRVSGTGKKGTEDVDAHVHLGPQTYYADKMATTKDFVIP